jgi:O-antigen ligase
VEITKRTKIRSIDSSAIALRWLLWGGASITLLFWTNLNDPFNAPKSWALSIIAFWLFGWIIFQIKGQWANRTTRVATILAFAFWFTLTVAFLATDNKFTGFFGEYQRKTGYLTYSSFIFLFIAATYLISPSKLDSLDRVALFIGSTSGVYGLIQHFGKDFVHWNNPYNSVLGTLGNPDFAAAVMAIFAILNFGIILKEGRKSWERVLALSNTTLLFVVIQFAQVRQGLITATLGIGIVILVWIYQKNRVASFIFAGISSLITLLSIAGALNKGPLIKFFYKASVTYRGDYWRAGWRMFIFNPIFGVGLDRYGANFRAFRDNTQTIRRGPNLVSNAAHNVPIQLAATGGIFLLTTYLALTLFIAWRALIALKKSTGTGQIATATVIGAWVAYEAQSFISIDNIGIAIWGYILGGAVVGLSIIPVNTKAKIGRNSHLQPIFSSLFAAAFLVVSVFFFQAETAMHAFESTAKPSSQADLQAYEVYAKKPILGIFKEPALIFLIASDLASAGDLPDAKNLLINQINQDSKNYESFELLAEIFEYEKNWERAIEIRLRIDTLDPFNSKNISQLKLDRDF